MSDWFRGGAETESGVHVNEKTALQMAIIWQAVNWRAKMYGHLPHKVFENVEILGRPAQREARQHPLFPIIHTAPNPTLTAAAWFGLISADLHLDGNSYAWQERGSQTGRLKHLWRFTPDAIRLEQTSDGAILYHARKSDGTEETFSADEVLHIRGLGYDGVRGYNPIRMMRNELGWALGTRQFSSKFYKNAFRPSGLLISPNTIKEPAKTDLINALKASGKDGGLALIEGAMEYKQMQIPQDDAQFLETIQLQDDRLAGIMEVHPHELGVTRNLNNSITEQMTINSVTRNLLPFSVGVEQWMNLQLFSDAPSSGRGGGTERDRFFIQSNFNALMRGDTAAQTAHIREMISASVYSGNDGREYLGLPPVAGGDRYYVNGAMIPIDKVDEVIAKRGMTPGAKPPGEPGDPGKNAQALLPLFIDAAGRVLKRKSQERAQCALTAFQPALEALAQIMGVDDPYFAANYIRVLAKCSVDWKSDSVFHGNNELEGAIAALKERQS